MDREVLPTTVRPDHYVLTLTPDLEVYSDGRPNMFDGEVTVSYVFPHTIRARRLELTLVVRIIVNKQTDQIVMHANDLEISKAEFADNHSRLVAGSIYLA